MTQTPGSSPSASTISGRTSRQSRPPLPQPSGGIAMESMRRSPDDVAEISQASFDIAQLGLSKASPFPMMPTA
jgi:hypothetical protein